MIREEIVITPELVRHYAEASGDYSAIHLDEEAAQAAGFARPLAHGMLSMGLCARLLHAFSDGELRQFDTRFSAPLLVGETLVMSGSVTSIAGAQLTVSFQGTAGGQTILTGTFTLSMTPVVIITGSTRGIGYATAKRLAAAGMAVVINGRSPERVAAVVDEIVSMGGKAVGVSGSVADMATGENLLAAALAHFGRADVLINNAGVTRDRMAHKLTEADWDEVLLTHLKGAFSCTKPFLQQARTGGGTIINMVSSAAWDAVPGQLNYSAAKAGLLAMTRTLAAEGARSGLRVYAVAPAALTDMTRPFVEQAKAEAAAAGRELDPYWRIGSADDVAQFLETLLAEGTLADSGSSYTVNGTSIAQLT